MSLFAIAPALPLGTRPGKYVAAAYIVFLAIVLIYVAIMAVRRAAPGARALRAAPRRRGRPAPRPRAEAERDRETVL